MAQKRKQLTFTVTVTVNRDMTAAQARRDLKQRANHSGFEFWDGGLKVNSVKPGAAQ